MNQSALSLFDETDKSTIMLADGAYLLKGFASTYLDALLPDLRRVIEAAPFTHMITPGGFRMSVAMTSCGQIGWVTDRRGYRYDQLNPVNNEQWPEMPVSFLSLAYQAAKHAGYDDFVPDSCLINRYESGARLSLHQDRNEVDYNAPIVSVSLGIPATFLFGGLSRSDKTQRLGLNHGDVVVWGGASRLFYHGVQPVKASHHPETGEYRINLTFRKAG